MLKHACVTSALPTPLFPLYPLWSYQSPETVRTKALIHQGGWCCLYAHPVFSLFLTHDHNRSAKISKVCVIELFSQSSSASCTHRNTQCIHTALCDKSNACYITDLPVTIKGGLSPALTLIHSFSPVRCLSRESDGGHRATRGKEGGRKSKEARASFLFSRIFNDETRCRA